MNNTKIAEVLDHIFETFYDNDANTKHLDHDFAQQIVDVEKYLKIRLKDLGISRQWILIRP